METKTRKKALIMKYTICFIFILCSFACTHKSVDYTCEYTAIQDNYPKGAKDLYYGREICCILKFQNIGTDSIYLPFHKLGVLRYKSWFKIKYNGKTSECLANFWGYQTNTFVVAPGEFVRIGVVIYPDNLDELKIDQDIDIQDLSKMISIFYQYDPADSSYNHLKTPIIEIKRDSVIKLIYDANLF